jgi:hypothetical protein
MSLIRRNCLLLLALGALVCAAPAGASQLIDRNATDVSLKADAIGNAVVSYTVDGRVRHVIAWGAVDARPVPAQLGVRQERFRLDYSGGWGYKRDPSWWERIPDSCSPYDGPALAYLVTACKAGDGTYWALQAWQQELPNLGVPAWTAKQLSVDLQLSHFTSADTIAKLEVHTDWVNTQRAHHLFGQLTYAGLPVHGFSTTAQGAPLDGYGRLVFLDTYNSKLGPGWQRENSFVAQNPTGVFCYGFYPRAPYAGYPTEETRPPANGERYRLSVIGPGVSPDVAYEIPGLPDYDPNNADHVGYETAMNERQLEIVGGGKLCRQG